MMMNAVQKAKISIARNFSKVPAGRYFSDGDESGQAFREKWLKPKLSNGDHIIVDLDNTEGYGSSFLEEAFGGLIREGFSLADLSERIDFISDEDPTLIEEIVGYMESASRKLHPH